MDSQFPQSLMTKTLSIMNIINRANRTVGESHNGGREELAVSPIQIQALIAIWRHQVLNMTELSRELCITKSQTTKIVDVLVGGNLVERKEDPASRRVILIRLTCWGNNYLEEKLLKGNHLLAKAFGEMDREEAEKVAEAFDILIKAFHKVLYHK